MFKQSLCGSIINNKIAKYVFHMRNDIVYMYFDNRHHHGIQYMVFKFNFSYLKLFTNDTANSSKCSWNVKPIELFLFVVER